MSRILQPALLLCALLGIAVGSPLQADVTEEFRTTKPLAAHGTVSLSNINGSIHIEGWDREEVQLVAVKQASSQRHLDAIRIHVVSKPASFSVETEHGQSGWSLWRSGSQEVRYTLHVPRSATVEQVESVNGSVTLLHLSGALRVETVNGGIHAEGIAAGSRLETVNGSIRASLGSLSHADRLNLETVNGSVVLALPGSPDAELHAETINGSIRNEFGLSMSRDRTVGQSLEATLGRGGARLDVSTVNGSIRFVKAVDADD